MGTASLQKNEMKIKILVVVVVSAGSNEATLSRIVRFFDFFKIELSNTIIVYLVEQVH